MGKKKKEKFCASSLGFFLQYYKKEGKNILPRLTRLTRSLALKALKTFERPHRTKNIFKPKIYPWPDEETNLQGVQEH